MRYMMLIGLFAMLVACGGDDGSDAGDFAKTTVENMTRGQWGRVYEDLHPGQQAVIDRDLYIECQSAKAFPAYEVDVDDTYDDRLTVAAVGETDTEAVTLELTNGDNAQFMTVNIVTVDGEMKWITSAEAIASFEAGECP